MTKKLKIKTGKISLNGAKPQSHELETYKALAASGNDININKESNQPKRKNPDFDMLGKTWETKSPTGKSKSTIEHNFQRAAKQAHHIVIDLRRTRINDTDAIETLQKLFNTSKSVKTLWAIDKHAQIIKLKKSKKVLPKTKK